MFPLQSPLERTHINGVTNLKGNNLHQHVEGKRSNIAARLEWRNYILCEFLFLCSVHIKNAQGVCVTQHTHTRDNALFTKQPNCGTRDHLSFVNRRLTYKFFKAERNTHTSIKKHSKATANGKSELLTIAIHCT